MLSYALAITVAASSLAVFLTAFFMSDIHRRDDFLWSGVGLFYALVLWFCARNITGAVLLGQAAAATLLVSYSWQTLKLRKAVANPEQTAEITNFSVLRSLNNLLSRNKSQPQAPVVPSADKVTAEVAIPNSTSSTKSVVPDQKKSGMIGNLFSKKKSTTTNTKLDEILDDEPVEQSEKSAMPVASVEQKVQPVIESETLDTDKTDSNQISTTQEVVELSSNTETDVKDESTAEPPQSKDLMETSDSQLEEPKEDTVIDSYSESEEKAEETVVSPIEVSATNPTVDNSEQLEEKTEETVVSPIEVSATNPTVDNSEQLEEKTEETVVSPVEVSTTNPTIGNFSNELEPEKIENPIIEVETPPTIVVPENSATNLEKEPEAIAKEISETQNDEAETNKVSQVDIDSNLADSSTEDSESFKQNQSVAKPSSLDSLETVEVAEVLEALPDDRYGDRNLDKSSIIEVTTTDINITDEVKKIDSDPKENMDQN